MTYEARCILERIESILKSNAANSRGISKLALRMLIDDIKTGEILSPGCDTVTAMRRTVELAVVR